MKKNSENKVIFICWLAYTAAYVGRLNFSASIVGIIADLGATKAQAGLVSSCFFFAYGAGQLVNGILSKRYNTKIMVFISLACSAVLNILMPLFGSISAMKYIWLLNGAFQSILWSSLIKTISGFVSDKKLPGAILAMSTTVAAGTFAAYGISALSIKSGFWQASFYSAAIILLVSSALWLALYENPSVIKSDIQSTPKGSKSKIAKPVLAALITTALAGVAGSFIKDGINTWVPSILLEVFDFTPSISIMLTLLLPLVSTLGAAVAKKIHEKMFSHSAMNMIFFSISAFLCFGILLSLKIHSVVAIMACFILVACLMSMINNVITSMFALDYRNVLDAGFAAGLLNTFCYIGSTVTSYTLGAVSQTKGWNDVFILMLAVCAVAVAVCAVGLTAEKSKKHEHREENINVQI